MNFPKRIETPRLIIENFVHSDINDEYITWLNDKELMQYSNQRFKSHDKESCRKYLSSFDSTCQKFLAIRRKDGSKPPRLVGTITLYTSTEHQTADIGLLIGIQAQGYGSESWNAVFSSLLQLKFRKITAGCAASNTAMRKIIENSGMELEATRQAQELIQNEPVDILYYAYFPS